MPDGLARGGVYGLGEGCQCVIWRDGDRRCELWMVRGQSRLRLFAGAVMMLDEPFVRGKGWARAQELRDDAAEPSGG